LLVAALSANVIHATFTHGHNNKKNEQNAARNVAADSHLSQLIILTTAGLKYPSKLLNYSTEEPIGLES
jgi:hypothetical protein